MWKIEKRKKENQTNDPLKIYAREVHNSQERRRGEEKKYIKRLESERVGCDDEEFNSRGSFVPFHSPILNDEMRPAIGFISERAHFGTHTAGGKYFCFYIFLFSLSAPPSEFFSYYTYIYLFWGSCIILLMGSERNAGVCCSYRLWLLFEQCARTSRNCPRSA